MDCTKPPDTYQYVSEWNSITAPTCPAPVPTINAPVGMLPNPVPPPCNAGSWCSAFTAETQYGLGCIRADTQNLISSYILFEGSVTNKLFFNGYCDCLNYCGEINGSGDCTAVEVVFAYKYDAPGTMVRWCNLYTSHFIANADM